MGASLEVKRLSLCYGKTTILHDLNFALEAGEIGCLLGGSGCGKTSLLRALAGFEPLQRGEVWIDSQLVSSSRFILEPERRQLGMVFQDFALFPHLDSLANVASGLSRLPQQEQRQRAGEELARVGLDNAAGLYPHQLSGGQQQRLAIARALAPRPRALLMDEPFSNLDPEMHDSLRHDLLALLKQSGTTCVLVTHDQRDAFALADKVGVIHAGNLAQWNSAYALYHTPQNRYVADFIGRGVFIHGKGEATGVRTELGLIKGDLDKNLIGKDVELLLRPEDLVFDKQGDWHLPIAAKVFRGDSFLYTLELPSGFQVLASVASHHDYPPGETLDLRLEIDHLVAFGV